MVKRIFVFKLMTLALILNIETATKNCSVSLSEGSKILSVLEENTGGYSHAEKLHPFIDEVLKNSNKTFADLDAVAVSMGPGSYTGLRIGVSAAKGICYANDLPLIALSTLESMANSRKGAAPYLVPMLDARRMEVYSSIFSDNMELVRSTEAEIIDEKSFSDLLATSKVLFFGDGAEKCKEIITSKNAVFLDNIFPSAKDMPYSANIKFEKKDFVDVAYFEPFYLKDFVATKSLKRA